MKITVLGYVREEGNRKNCHQRAGRSAVSQSCPVSGFTLGKSEVLVLTSILLPCGNVPASTNLLFFSVDLLRFYLFMRDRGRDSAEGEVGSLWGARCGTRSQDHGITP